MNVFIAIKEMKRISRAGGTFAIKFRKCDRQRKKGGDMVILTSARCRKKSSDEKIQNSSHKLYLTDTSTGHPLNCWQCLIMEYNGEKLTF